MLIILTAKRQFLSLWRKRIPTSHQSWQNWPSHCIKNVSYENECKVPKRSHKTIKDLENIDIYQILSQYIKIYCGKNMAFNAVFGIIQPLIYWNKNKAKTLGDMLKWGKLQFKTFIFVMNLWECISSEISSLTRATRKQCGELISPLPLQSCTPIWIWRPQNNQPGPALFVHSF